jgi:hypothetical protein
MKKISFWIVEDENDPVYGTYAVCDSEEAAKHAVHLLMTHMGYDEYTSKQVSEEGIQIRPWNVPLNVLELDGVLHPLSTETETDTAEKMEDNYER